MAVVGRTGDSLGRASWREDDQCGGNQTEPQPRSGGYPVGVPPTFGGETPPGQPAGCRRFENQSLPPQYLMMPSPLLMGRPMRTWSRGSRSIAHPGTGGAARGRSGPGGTTNGQSCRGGRRWGTHGAARRWGAGRGLLTAPSAGRPVPRLRILPRATPRPAESPRIADLPGLGSRRLPRRARPG